MAFKYHINDIVGACAGGGYVKKQLCLSTTLPELQICQSPSTPHYFETVSVNAPSRVRIEAKWVVGGKKRTEGGGEGEGVGKEGIR